jgi:hypothetical protein
MPRTIRLYYSKACGLKGRNRVSFDWAPITRRSVVFISAAEGYDLGPPLSSEDPHIVFNLGASDIYVTNVSPRDGGVDFILYSQWNLPLNIIVNISVFDPPEEVRIL